MDKTIYIGTLSLDNSILDLSPGSSLRITLNQEFMHPNNSDFRNWYFSTFSKEQLDIFKQQYFTDLQRTNKIKYFIPWFFYYSLYNITHQINVLEKQWTFATGESITQVHPPSGELAIRPNVNSQAFFQTAEALVAHSKNLTSIHKQLNFTNAFLQTLGAQLTRIEKLLENSKVISIPENDFHLKAPLIKPVETSSCFENKQLSVDSIIQEFQKKFSHLNIGTLSSDPSFETLATELSAQFSPDPSPLLDVQTLKTKLSPLATKKILRSDPRPLGKYYYTRPTPLDLTLEEQGEYSQRSYHAKTGYTRNIDGLSNRMIHEMCHRMLLYATIQKGNGDSDLATAKAIVAGFEGTLKGWWDHKLHITEVCCIY